MSLAVRLTTSILFRVNRLRISLMQRVGHGYAQRNTPLLLNAYEALGRLGGSGARNQPYKGYHLWKSLLKFKPKKITEMGSGTTSAVFALYAKQYEASYEAFEHSEHWGEKTVAALRESNLADDAGPIKIVDSYVAPDGSGSAFAEPIHNDTDFLYIDGPPCPVIEGVKKPNLDVIQLFERGDSRKPYWWTAGTKPWTLSRRIRRASGIIFISNSVTRSKQALGARNPFSSSHDFTPEKEGPRSETGFRMSRSD